MVHSEDLKIITYSNNTFMDDIIIDTNILLLLIIGSVEQGRHIKNSKRLQGFNEEDYQNVLSFIKRYMTIFITHYIAAEVSNLIDLKKQAGKKAYGIARIMFNFFIQIDSKINDDVSSDTFLRYGITDNSIIRLVNDFQMLTNDEKLCEQLWSINQDNVFPYTTLKKMSRL